MFDYQKIAKEKKKRVRKNNFFIFDFIMKNKK